MHLLIECIEQTLLPNVQIESLDPHEPVVVHSTPAPWQLLGCGNYAAVFCHASDPDVVVKIYAPDRPGLAEEAEVYRRLGNHPAFSQCWHVGNNYLLLKRLYGTTLYNCLHQGLVIPKQVIVDIDQALNDARSRGLYPHDVHGRNVMMHEGRGLVVDISDFLEQQPCSAWDDLKRAYYWIYRPFLAPLRVRVPHGLLNWVRRMYRLWRRFWRRWRKP
jgi:hypothetical protein